MQLRAFRATLIVALALSHAGVSQAAVTAAPPAAGAAAAWLVLLDHGRWPQSWITSGALFHSQTTAQQWSVMAGAVRSPLGAALSRKLAGAERTHRLPGAPDGDYAVLRYDTRFAHKAAAVETVVLARETGGWKVDGYFIK